MKKNINIFMTLFLLALCGCGEVEQKVPRQTDSDQYNENPVAAYCGVGCARCNNSEEQCLRLLQENISMLCDQKKENCYEVWVRYARHCKRSCTG